MVIRLCLYYGVTPVSIPNGKSWRAGEIGKSDDTHNRTFFRRHWFSNDAALRRQSKHLQRLHNEHRCSSCLKGKTPREIIRNEHYEPVTVSAHTKLPELDEIPDGNLIQIRFIRSNRLLAIFGERYKVPQDLVYSYVKATIGNKLRSRQAYQEADIIEKLDYWLSCQGSNHSLRVIDVLIFGITK